MIAVLEKIVGENNVLAHGKRKIPFYPYLENRFTP